MLNASEYSLYHIPSGIFQQITYFFISYDLTILLYSRRKTIFYQLLYLHAFTCITNESGDSISLQIYIKIHEGLCEWKVVNSI